MSDATCAFRGLSAFRVRDSGREQGEYPPGVVPEGARRKSRLSSADRVVPVDGARPRGLANSPCRVGCAQRTTGGVRPPQTAGMATAIALHAVNDDLRANLGSFSNRIVVF